MPLPTQFSQFWSSKSAVACTLGLVYLGVVRLLRWKRYNAIHKKYSAKFHARTLTPEEAQEVIQLAFQYDMPILSEYSLVRISMLCGRIINDRPRPLLCSKHMRSCVISDHQPVPISLPLAYHIQTPC